MTDGVWDMRNVADVPPELCEVFSAHLKRVRHLIPLWCSRIRVLYQSAPAEQDSGCNATIRVHVEYREATLNIMPRWLDLDDAARHKTLVHEISHFPTRQIFDLAHTIVDNAVEDEGMRNILKEQIRVATEAATEDTAQMILRGEKS